MSEAPVAKAKLRYYNDDFIMFGLVSVDAKPMCLECDVMLTNDSMKKVKLLHHQKSKHSSSVGKDREYFERKKKTQPVKLFDFVKKMNTAMQRHANQVIWSPKFLPRLEHFKFMLKSLSSLQC